ncbi:hypothetical protein DMX11_12405 [Pseudomonas sp. LB-090624]|nr:hypothetical protein DMX11_12405 [Pseudomonas sp. LB-090624]
MVYSKEPLQRELGVISRFSGKNYKAFDSFDLDLKPLTILLGANSSGKSALINSLLMLSQSADSSAISESPLRLNGNKTGMGETLNIIKDKNPLNKLSFTFEFDSKDSLRKNLAQAKSNIVQSYETIPRWMAHSATINNVKSSTFSRQVSKIEELTETLSDPSKVSEFKKHYTKVVKTYRAIMPTERKLRAYPDGFINISEEASIQKIEDCMDAFLGVHLSRLIPAQVTYTFTYNKRKEVLVVSEYTQHNKFGNVIFSYKKEGNNISITSDVISSSILGRSRSEILKVLTLDSLQVASGVNIAGNSYGGLACFQSSSSPVASALGLFLNSTSRHLLQNLAGLQVNHVSPLRAFPQRYYVLDKSIHHRKLNALDGTELAEILKNNPTIKDEINILFSRFNIGIDVEKVNDIIYKIVVNQNNVNLELTDVGFGISQVLPILVQAYLSPRNSLTIIEQPEIHLHPSMQAWLADALISIALKSDKRFLVETHSDALIRRIRLRIVDESSKLTEEQVKIYYLHKDTIKKCTILDDIEINENGDVKWPKDFMDVEIKDSIEIQQLKYAKVHKDNKEQNAQSADIEVRLQ